MLAFCLTKPVRQSGLRLSCFIMPFLLAVSSLFLLYKCWGNANHRKPWWGPFMINLFFYKCIPSNGRQKSKVKVSHGQLCDAWTVARRRLRYPRNSPGKNAGVGCHFSLQCEKRSGQKNGRIPGDGIFKRQYWQIGIVEKQGPSKEEGLF